MLADQFPFRVRRLPRPGRHTFERRKQRSNNAAEAIELAYSCATRRANLDVLLLVDGEGMLVATSQTDLDLTMLAAVTPIIGRGKARPKIHRDGKKKEMSVRTIELMGEVMYVAAIGGDILGRNRELTRSLGATERILA